MVQVYLALPDPKPGVVQPPAQLKGFQRVRLAPGGRTRVRIDLDERALSYWDTAADGWRVAPGCVGVLVGRSSRDIVARGTLAVEGAECPKGSARVPAARTCVSRRTVIIRRLGVRASRIRRLDVFVGGKRQRRLRGPRRAVKVMLAGRPKQRVAVRLAIGTRTGRTVTVRRPIAPARSGSDAGCTRPPPVGGTGTGGDPPSGLPVEPVR